VALLGGEKKTQRVINLGETPELDYTSSVFVRMKGEVTSAGFKKYMPSFGKTMHYALGKIGETVTGTVT